MLFGSALGILAVDTFYRGFDRYTLAPEYPDEFGMKVLRLLEMRQIIADVSESDWRNVKVKSPLSNADHVRFGEEVGTESEPDPHLFQPNMS